MMIWRVACWLMGHLWEYHETYRVCSECGHMQRIPQC
jgi:hypothetical protein